MPNSMNRRTASWSASYSSIAHLLGADLHERVLEHEPVELTGLGVFHVAVAHRAVRGRANERPGVGSVLGRLHDDGAALRLIRAAVEDVQADRLEAVALLSLGHLAHLFQVSIGNGAPGIGPELSSGSSDWKFWTGMLSEPQPMTGPRAT